MCRYLATGRNEFFEFLLFKKNKKKLEKIWKFCNACGRWFECLASLPTSYKLEFNFVEILEEIWAANLNFPLETIEDRFCGKNDGNNFFFKISKISWNIFTSRQVAHFSTNFGKLFLIFSWFFKKFDLNLAPFNSNFQKLGKFF